MSAAPTTWTARRQAAALASGEISAQTLVAAHLDRITREDGAIGAFWTIDAEGGHAAAEASDARRRAGRPLGPFDGVPIAVKDNIDVAGLPTTAGLAAYRDRVAMRDAPCVARLRAAGLVILGKLALHEGALGATTDTPGFGRCQNPLKIGLTPGGSSGGSGAAVAAGFVPWALGTDTLGSVRIPAAYCGVVGLKPSEGLVSRSGVVPLSTTLDTVGVLARDAADAVALAGLMAGEDIADPLSVPVPAGWSTEPRTPLALKSLRLGVPTAIGHVAVEPALLAALDEAVDRLRGAGATVVSLDISDWEPGATRRAGLLLAEAEGAVAHAALIDDASAASSAYRSALAYGRAASSTKLVAALDRLLRVRAGARRALRTVDALVLPTAPQRAFAHGAEAPDNQADLTALASVAGLPALAIPLTAPDGGLPASLQIVGRPFEEARLLAIAMALSAL